MKKFIIGVVVGIAAFIAAAFYIKKFMNWDYCDCGCDCGCEEEDDSCCCAETPVEVDKKSE